MKEFYPQIEPYRAATLQVSELHTVFYEEVGNPVGRTWTGISHPPAARSCFPRNTTHFADFAPMVMGRLW